MQAYYLWLCDRILEDVPYEHKQTQLWKISVKIFAMGIFLQWVRSDCFIRVLFLFATPWAHDRLIH